MAWKTMAVMQNPEDGSSEPLQHQQHHHYHHHPLGNDPASAHTTDHSSNGATRMPRPGRTPNFSNPAHPATRKPSLKRIRDSVAVRPPNAAVYTSSVTPSSHRYHNPDDTLDYSYAPSIPSPSSSSFASGTSHRDLRVHTSRDAREPNSLSHQIPSPPISPRWDSLPNSALHVHSRVQPSMPSSPSASTFPHESSVSGGGSHQSIDTIASETRDEFPSLPVTRTNMPDSPMAVGNFSRPRLPSLKQPHIDSPRLRSPTQPHLDTSQLEPLNNSANWPRSRGPSISSNQSASTYASVSLRPSQEIYHERSRGRPRPQHTIPARQALTNIRAESSGPAFTRGLRDPPIPRMASLPSDELRSSFRSQLSTSTAQGTLATERSSVMTKSSSITSVYGNVDNDLSVDDVLGLYDKGFDDDSAGEDEDFQDDTRPPTGVSELSKMPTTALEVTPEEMSLPEPPFVSADSGVVRKKSIVRDSAAIFRVSNHVSTPSEDARVNDDVPSRSGNSPVSSPDQFRPSPPIRHETTLTTTGFDERDRYGFKKSSQYITSEEYDSWDSGYSEFLVRRKRKWVLHLKENGLMTDAPNRFPPRSAKTKRFVRKGIPPEWRGAAWFYYAGGPAILQKHRGLYDDLLKSQVKDVDAEAIERDLHRTFPDNIRFRSSPGPILPAHESNMKRNSQRTVIESDEGDIQRDETPMISSLRRVLTAFSIYNPRIGYCQSLNFLAGLLLLFVESEEHAFWLLNIITRVYLPGTHEMSLEGANVDLGVLMTTIQESMPNVWAKIGGELDGTDAVRPKSRRHLRRGEVTTRLPPITLSMTSWFMSCFIGTLPIESTLRVWDIFFYEGSKTLFRIALTILRLGEGEIKKVADPMEIFQVVQTMPRKMLDANGLMEACYRRRNGFGHLSQETIEQRRQERRMHVKAEKEKLAAGIPVTPTDGDVSRMGTLFKRGKAQTVHGR
ncbi:RabGAP/TBC [Xylariaceae sp. FL1272]|nr:RabGAP/TBC [Xylariaceae sp. FL1272]